jgi:hypothetical protein
MDVPSGPGRHWPDASLNDPELPFFENGTCSVRFCVAAGDDGTPRDPGRCWPVTFSSVPEPPKDFGTLFSLSVLHVAKMTLVPQALAVVGHVFQVGPWTQSRGPI